MQHRWGIRIIYEMGERTRRQTEHVNNVLNIDGFVNYVKYMYFEIPWMCFIIFNLRLKNRQQISYSPEDVMWENPPKRGISIHGTYRPEGNKNNNINNKISNLIPRYMTNSNEFGRNTFLFGLRLLPPYRCCVVIVVAVVRVNLSVLRWSNRVNLLEIDIWSDRAVSQRENEKKNEINTNVEEDDWNEHQKRFQRWSGG